MTAPSSAVPPPTVVGVIGLTPSLAEALRVALNQLGYVTRAGGTPLDGLILVSAAAPCGDAPLATLVILASADGQTSTPPRQLPAGLPSTTLTPPFELGTLLAAVTGAWREAEARRAALGQIERLIALQQQVVALCDDPERDPQEVAPALADVLQREMGYAETWVTFAPGAAADDFAPGASLVVPITTEDGASGAIGIRPQTAPDQLDVAHQRRLLATVATQAGTYLSRRTERARAAQLRAADVRLVQELAAMNEVALATASLDLDQVLAGLLPRTRTLLRADYCTLVLHDKLQDTLTIRAADGEGAAQIIGLELAAKTSFSRQIIEQRVGLRWNRNDTASVALVTAIMHPASLPYATIGAPLLMQDRAIGTIIAANHRTEEFTDADLRFLTAIAAQAAVAVENAHLYADTLRLARYDQLTGLANRRYFLETLGRTVETAARYDRPLALLLIDLDHFKNVNDTAGHLAGDALLREIAVRLVARLRRSDFPARYAGDELAMILPETGLSGAMTLAERLRSAVASAPIPVGETTRVWLTLSVGVAVYTPGTTVTDFLRAADSALYFAKHEGRNRVCGPDAAQVALTGPIDELATILRGGNQAVIEELAAAVDARVAQSTGQAALVAQVAVALGRVIGLATNEIDTLRSAALVHDIGEIAIAPDILGRPGPLGVRERALVRAHPRRSYDLLAAVPAFQEALPLILHHHERWDGDGYPDNLAGEAIPLGARIIAVADAWVALTTDRPHRAALGPAEALAEIIRGAGAQFDPAVVAALPNALR